LTSKLIVFGLYAKLRPLLTVDLEIMKIENILNSSIDKFIIVGDRLLIKPKEINAKTKSGLFLPPGVTEKEKIQSGHVLKVGPGYAVASNVTDENPWEESLKKEVHYIPLQAHEGDLAIFIQSLSFEIEYEQEKYLIVPQSSVLMLIRENE
jgi:chaperonin GroES